MNVKESFLKQFLAIVTASQINKSPLGPFIIFKNSSINSFLDDARKFGFKRDSEVL